MPYPTQTKSLTSNSPNRWGRSVIIKKFIIRTAFCVLAIFALNINTVALAEDTIIKDNGTIDATVYYAGRSYLVNLSIDAGDVVSVNAIESRSSDAAVLRNNWQLYLPNILSNGQLLTGVANFRSSMVNLISLSSDSTPEGSPWPIGHANHPIPPSSFYGAAVIWFQSAIISSDPHSPQTGMITVDSYEIVEIDRENNQSIVLSTEEYDQDQSEGLICIFPSGQCDGAIYKRIPTWFPDGDYHTAIENSTISNGKLSLPVANSGIVHWWSPRFHLNNPDSRYGVRMRIRITGDIGFQLGMDFWRDLTANWSGDSGACIYNNCESWVSPWLLKTPSESFVKIFCTDTGCYLE